MVSRDIMISYSVRKSISFNFLPFLTVDDKLAILSLKVKIFSSQFFYSPLCKPSPGVIAIWSSWSLGRFLKGGGSFLAFSSSASFSLSTEYTELKMSDSFMLASNKLVRNRKVPNIMKVKPPKASKAARRVHLFCTVISSYDWLAWKTIRFEVSILL